MVSVCIKSAVEMPVRYLRASCGVRYWEDATVNGVDDEEGDLIPCRAGDCWSPIIDLETGAIIGWPEGTTAEINYKVCDDGRYALHDADMALVVGIEGYVPTIMCPGGPGYSDYVIMTVGPDGRIADWRLDLSEFEEVSS